MRCPNCKSDNLYLVDGYYKCAECGAINNETELINDEEPDEYEII
jgi:DNA-directed RNA polymerase subunit RPC12/RpoP